MNDACACDTDAHAYCAGFYSADWQVYARANGYTTASWKYGLLDCLGKPLEGNGPLGEQER